MKADIIFALDVGGTFIKACVIEKETVIKETICQFEARAKENQDILLDHFNSIFRSLAAKYKHYKQSSLNQKIASPFHQKVLGIGFAFPGPFDYDQGISYIKGLDKFESLYGVCLREKLLQGLESTELGVETKEILLYFENDGRLFGLGASTQFPDEKLICLTLGTGLGTVFIDQKRIIKKAENIPPEGYLYNQLFKGIMVDDYFSRRGILKAATAKESQFNGLDVKELADLARGGNDLALSIFHQFGCDLGEMLLPFIKKFYANRIILGGQIAKSIDLFQSKIEEQLHDTNTKVNFLDNGLHYTFRGISQLFE